MIRIFLAAGETSGDIHGANLVRALRAADADVVCEGLGGPRMAEAGMALREDLAGRAIMGFAEVARSLPYIRRVFRETEAHLAKTRPDCVVLIDYPGFNMRLAAKAKAMGLRVAYYISPQVWAWKAGRVRTLARIVDKMLVILPFEEKLYREAGVDCVFVGHPLMDQLETAPVEGIYRGGLVVGLLPGSREQEIRRLMQPMIDVARGIRAAYPEARFIAPCVNAAREAQVRALAGDFPLETATGRMYEVLDAARFCLVASGTATLETALFGVPMAILYKTGRLNYWIARRLVRISHIGLANILAGRGIVPEFIQEQAASDVILPVALELMADTPRRKQMLEDLTLLRAALGGSGASKRAAGAILDVARNK